MSSAPHIASRPVAVNLLSMFDAVATPKNEETKSLLADQHALQTENLERPVIDGITKTIAKENLSSTPPSVPSRGSCVVHAIKSIKTCSLKVINKTQKAFETTISIAGSLVTNPTFLASVFRRSVSYVIPLIEHTSKTANLTLLKRGLSRARDSIDVLQVDYHLITSGRWKEGDLAESVSNVSFFVSGVLGNICWLADIGAINLEKTSKAIANLRLFRFIPAVLSNTPGLKNLSKLGHIAAKIGNVRLFSGIGKLSLGFLVERILGVAYVCLAVHAIQRLAAGGTGTQMTKAALDLADSVSTIALDIVVLAGLTNVVALGVMGCISLGLTVSNYIYELKNKDNLCMMTT